jgi:microcystin-dependent protein
VGQFVYGGSTITAGTTGGSSTQTLAVTNLPAHGHGITDSGHNHAITDNGHVHTASDSGHNHTVTDPGHKHGISTLPNQWSANGAGAITFFSGTKWGDAGPYTTDSANTGISLSNGNANISVANAKTGISLGSATTGISIQNTGSGTAFSIMPPYIVLCYIMKY